MPNSEAISSAGSLKNDEGIIRFIENAPVPISFIDNKGNFLYTNKAHFNFFGYKEENITGKNISLFYGPKETFETFIEKVISAKEDVHNEELEITCFDRTRKNVLVSTHHHWKDDVYLYTMLVSRDITSLKKVEKLTRFLNTASEELSRKHDTEGALNKILEFIVPDFADWFTIELLTDEGKIELAKMAHSDPEKIEWAKKYRELHPTNLEEKHYGSVGWVLSTGETSFFPFISEEMIIAAAKTPEEAEVLVNLSIHSAITVPIKIQQEVIGCVSFISTKKNKFYDQVDKEFAENFTNRIGLTLETSRLFEDIRKDISNKIAANKQKDDFLAIASHELKTPLTSVKGYIHILSNLIKKGEEIASLNILKKTERQINKMAKLIHSFLDISRLESSKLVIEKEEFDLNELVSETINYYNLPENKERLRFNSGNIPLVNADRSKISQVIDNYLSNALKYSSTKDLVILKTYKENDEVIVAVSDTGIGIDENSQTKIFQRFYRAENMKSMTTSGFGIGLYLSIQILKLHNGRAWFESEEGIGSTFYFSLPIDK